MREDVDYSDRSPAVKAGDERNRQFPASRTFARTYRQKNSQSNDSYAKGLSLGAQIIGRLDRLAAAASHILTKRYLTVLVNYRGSDA